MKNFFNNLSNAGKGVLIIALMTLIYGFWWGKQKFFPKKAKTAQITTKATGLPPLSYDKSSNATFRAIPSFNEPAGIEAPEVRGAIMAWNGFSAVNYAVGGTQTSKGSIAEELGLNVHLSVQNSCSEQANQLYAFAQSLHEGELQPTKGVHFVNWMGDGVYSYISGLNERITKDFGPEYRAEVVTFAGASFGEDKWMLKAKYAKDARGSLTAAVILDGDQNIAFIKSQLMGWPLNNDLGTYDKTKVNFVAAPNDDYTEAGKMYISGAKVTLKLIQNGKYTGKDTTMAVTGVGSWFPVDQQLVQEKGGLVTVASTKEYGSQMACAIVMIKKWADDNRPIVEKLIEAIGRGGDQIKSHNEALQFATQVNEVVFADKTKTADDWYRAFKSFDMTDDDGNIISIGGSRVFSLADAASYTGVAGGSDTYKKVYNTFSAIGKEGYPERITTVCPYEEATDWSFLKAVYSRAKKSGTEGSVSKTNFSESTKGSVIGDASYTIEFDLGSAHIKTESLPILDKIVDQLGIVDNAFLEIGGHTDASGDNGKNQTLSQQRADAVREYLQSKASELSEKGRTSSKGWGSNQLKIPGNPLDPSNRRVTIKLYKAN